MVRVDAVEVSDVCSVSVVVRIARIDASVDTARDVPVDNMDVSCEQTHML